MTFASEVTTDSPELWWDTRQAVGASQPDASGNGHTGTITGSPTQDADGLTFDGSNHIESADFAPVAYASFALEAVVRPDVLTPYFGSIVDIYSPTLVGGIGINCQDDTNGVLTYQGQAQDADDLLFVVAVPGGDPVASGLQHLLLDFDGTDLTLYVDGAVYGTDSAAAFDIDFLEPAPFFLGDDVFGGDGYLGLIRHGIFYDHSLGPTRAAAHATAALTDDGAAGDPTVTNISPDQGTEDGGTSVTLTGTNFTGATSVKFGGVNAASYAVVDDDTITATTPAHSHISVHARVTTSAGTSATSSDDIFTFLAPAADPPDPVNIRVVDVNGDSHTASGLTDGLLPLAHCESITRTKNQPAEAVIVFPNYAYDRDDVHVFADDSGSGDYHVIEVIRNGIVRFRGPAVVADGASDDGDVTLHCRGVEWPLWQRFLDGQRTNELTNPSFETGDFTGYGSGVNLDNEEVTTDDAVRGTQSLRLESSTHLADAYKPQTVSITGTGVGTFVTFVYYFKLESITGHALDRRGLYVEATDGGPVLVNNFYAIDEATPTGEWIRAKTTLAVPPFETWDIEVRLYSPPGSILWDDGQAVAMQSVSTATITGNTYEPVDVSDIVGLVLDHGQNPAVGKSDLNLGLDNPSVGVRQVKHIQWADHISWADQMAEWLERDDCFDYSIVNNIGGTDVLTLHVPAQGTDRRATVTLEYPGNITHYEFTEDGGGTITDDTELADDTGDGPDREEGHYADASLIGGLTLQAVNAAPAKSEPSSLDPIARDKVRKARRPAMLLNVTLNGAAVYAGLPFDELLGLGDYPTVAIANGWTTVDGFGRITQIVEYPATDRKFVLTIPVSTP